MEIGCIVIEVNTRADDRMMFISEPRIQLRVVIDALIRYDDVIVIVKKVKLIRMPPAQLIDLISFLLVLFLIWAELAVGLFGTPFAGS